MKHIVTVIDFIEDMFYFELDDSTIYLCKTSSEGSLTVTTIKRVAISMNPEYAQWLRNSSGTFYKGTTAEENQLSYLFRHNHWFVSMEHSDFGKYLTELKRHMAELEE